MSAFTSKILHWSIIIPTFFNFPNLVGCEHSASNCRPQVPEAYLWGGGSVIMFLGPDFQRIYSIETHTKVYFLCNLA